MKNKVLSAFIICSTFMAPLYLNAQAPGEQSYISFKDGTGYFQLSANGRSTSIYTDSGEWPGVMLAVKSLQTDITSVTKASPTLLTDKTGGVPDLVIIGTLGKNRLLDKLVTQGKLNVSG